MTAASGLILIADDEDGLRWVLEKGFRGAGYTVTAVKDGTAARTYKPTSVLNLAGTNVPAARSAGGVAW